MYTLLKKLLLTNQTAITAGVWEFAKATTVEFGVQSDTQLSNPSLVYRYLSLDLSLHHALKTSALLKHIMFRCQTLSVLLPPQLSYIYKKEYFTRVKRYLFPVTITHRKRYRSYGIFVGPSLFVKLYRTDQYSPDVAGLQHRVADLRHPRPTLAIIRHTVYVQVHTF